MPKCQVDASIVRVVVEGFHFPLGVYPVEPMSPKPGYSMDFEPADGGGGGAAGGTEDSAGETEDAEDQWEEWPDRYMFDVVISADRLEALIRSLLWVMPGRVYPILDILGQDAYREVDPYVAYELVGQERFIDIMRRYRPMFLEDGLCGFGAMVDEPHFFYFFVDEHKIVTIRAETVLQDKIEKILAAFDLEQMESPAGADAAAHEHRGVLEHPDDRPDLLTMDEILEQLRDEWRLSLNIDPDTNVDDDGHNLGVTYWRSLVRCAMDADEKPKYAECLLLAGSLRSAEDQTLECADRLRGAEATPWDEAVVVASDRMTPEQAAEYAKARSIQRKMPSETTEDRIIWSGWLE
jgi:hypothetical protein